MALPATFAGWLEWATLAAIVVGMAWDALRLRIPHSVCIAIVALMPVWGLLQPGGVPWLQHALGLLVAFAIGFVLWRLRWFGGGDVKFLAAIALWVGIRDLGFFLVAMSLLGAALAILLLVLRPLAGAVRRAPEGDTAARVPMLRKGAPVPYGIAIGMAALLLQGAMFDV